MEKVSPLRGKFQKITEAARKTRVVRWGRERKKEWKTGVGCGRIVGERVR